MDRERDGPGGPGVLPVSVILWEKPGCCLCERAREILARLAAEYPLRVDRRDITTDADAFARYRYVIPVVEIEGGPRFEGKITELWLRRAIARILQHGR
ncbi:MAG: glutaredoxin family protein [Chloroflexi bacterium]|nr:glutaredoxin family protein [Chloroflexota bacterium]